MKKTLLMIFPLVISLSTNGQKMGREKIDELAKELSESSMDEFLELLRIPNNALNRSDIERNVEWCERAFQKRNFSTARLQTGGIPLLLAERKNPAARKTVLIYLQLDGQPVDGSRWNQPDPYDPALKRKINGNWQILDWSAVDEFEDDWRIFARSAADAKGPVAMFLAALDGLKKAGISPDFNIKVVMDFEEEIGSPRLPKAVRENTEQLAADMLLIFDGPRHLSNLPTLLFGARGIATVELTTYGPVTPQHSGHFGNYAPNPALDLSRLLAGMKDDNGKVIIDGYYDGVSIDPEEEMILRAVPDDERSIQERLQISAVDSVGTYYQESIQYPSLNIRGLQSGWINEEARTIVPAWAKAELDIRLVEESDPLNLIELIRRHVQNKGYLVLDHDPNKEERLSGKKVVRLNYDVSYQSFRTDFDSEVGKWLRKAFNRGFGSDPIMIRMTGGSVPIAPFVKALKVPAVIVPTVNSDNNQHSPNENIRIGNYREGIKTMLAVLSQRL